MDLTTWKEFAETSQQNASNLLGDRIWDRFRIPEEKKMLWQKIAFALFGPPRAENDEESYNDEQLKKINEILVKCVEKQGQDGLDLAFIFIYAYKRADVHTFVPLIRLRKSTGKDSNESYFIDHFGRVYQNWKDYLENNVFSGWWICVPNDAKYTYEGEVCTFIDQTARGQAVKTLDNVSTGVNIASGLSMAAGLLMCAFPPTLPVGVAIIDAGVIAGAPSAIYGTSRSAATLVDRHKHEQSLSLLDPEARASWLNIAGSILSGGMFASTKVLTSGAKVGSIASTEARAFCTALNVTNISVNGIGVLNALYEISQKKDVTSLDVLQLTTSLFFFTHAMVKFQTADGIIKDAQAKKIVSLRDKSENTDVFDQFQKAHREMVKPGKVRKMHGDAEFIRFVRKIDDKKQFFDNFSLTADKQLNVNKVLNIDAKAFLQINENQRSAILKLSMNLKRGNITPDEFQAKMTSICRENRITFERQRSQAKMKICRHLGVADLGEVNVGGERIFTDIKPHEIDRLDQIFQGCKNYNIECIKVGMKVADKMKCKNVTEFSATLEYTVRQLDGKIKSLKDANPNPDRPKGVKAKDYYQKIVYEEFIRNQKWQNEIMEKFRKLQETCNQANTAGSPRFSDPFSAANHYDKHAFLPKVDERNNLSPERYFDIAREMTEGEMTNPKWTQDGSSLVCQYMSDEYGAMAVRYDNLDDGTSVIATLMKKDMPVTYRKYDG